MNLSDAEHLFHEALTLSSPDARASFLEGACGSDNALRDKVRRLLEAHDQTVSLLPADPALPAPSPAPTEDAGSVIGRYKLLQRIGEGGMGVVYMAEQEEPVRRRVALKIIKLGMDTRAVVARFEAERQALALMDHPNIARVLDGGATETGRPYFVMELVQGVPITEYCDKNRLAASERLKLFVAVCQAIQSAHQKGIIHRDIKPSNVLVTIEHGEPMPKVIDFGIAKATHQKLTEKTLFTNYATMIGTPAYMSPEQAEMTSLDVDTRADIYSLGVLLYELLTGTTPFPAERLRSLGYGEMQRVIVEEEPDRPSTRLGTLTAEQKTAVARSRGNDLQALGALLRGDLDWIVMRCLEKDRRRRYETANALATDLQRHLGNEPVTARPPAVAYRFQKWVKRNRVVAVSTTAVALALIGAAVVSTAAFLRERSARLRAAAAEQAREAARRSAETEATRADTITLLVEKLFDRVVPKLAERGHMEAIQSLLAIADGVVADLTNAPKTEADIHLRLGMYYMTALQDYSHAEKQFGLMAKRTDQLARLGPHYSRMAQCLTIVARLGKTLDAERATDLEQIAKDALAQPIPDTEVAAHALSFVSLYKSTFGSATEAEASALEVLRFAPLDKTHAKPRAMALGVAIRSLVGRKAYAEAGSYAEQLLATVDWDGVNLDLDALDTYVLALCSIHEPEEAQARMRELLSQRPMTQAAARSHLTACLGAIMALGGDWHGSAPILFACATNSSATVREWQLAVTVLGLTGDRERRDQLLVRGLARFAGGSEPDTSRALAEGLLRDPVDASLVPVLREMLDHAQTGPVWTRVWALLPSGMLYYRTGAFARAIESADDFLKQTAALGQGKAGGNEPSIAAGLFLKACAEARLDRRSSGIECYREGRRMLPKSVIQEGARSHYKDLGMWHTACSAELLRREAIGLLGREAEID